jgi:hypothetical protein
VVALKKSNSEFLPYLKNIQDKLDALSIAQRQKILGLAITVSLEFFTRRSSMISIISRVKRFEFQDWLTVENVYYLMDNINPIYTINYNGNKQKIAEELINIINRKNTPIESRLNGYKEVGYLGQVKNLFLENGVTISFKLFESETSTSSESLKDVALPTEVKNSIIDLLESVEEANKIEKTMLLRKLLEKNNISHDNTQSKTYVIAKTLVENYLNNKAVDLSGLSVNNNQNSNQTPNLVSNKEYFLWVAELFRSLAYPESIIRRKLSKIESLIEILEFEIWHDELDVIKQARIDKINEYEKKISDAIESFLSKVQAFKNILEAKINEGAKANELEEFFKDFYINFADLSAINTLMKTFNSYINNQEISQVKLFTEENIDKFKQIYIRLREKTPNRYKVINELYSIINKCKYPQN